MATNYSAYFDIDEKYFPQVNDSTISTAAPDFWLTTYPHETFVSMLTSLERILARQEMRALWVEGAYGTGKSQCVYALKKILDVPEAELRNYWSQYPALQQKQDLLEKLIGHKKSGVLTAYRYASGSIRSPRDLFRAIQDSLKAALVQAGLYQGEHTIKESMIAWIEENPANKAYLDSLLAQSEWKALFAMANADAVLAALRDPATNLQELMNNLFRLADRQGIIALNINADRLIDWISDIIDRNNIKIVFIWDEFSDYFKNNRESLSEFQRLAELVSAKPFYFVVVTHESGQLYTDSDPTWKRVRDRFIKAEIRLPDNIAFELIGHALKVKATAKAEWSNIAGNLNIRLNTVRKKVMDEARITRPEVMQNIIPLHPMAALLLKYIATAYQSNQRSMFDFVKSTDNENVQAFQWFIANNGPTSNRPLLTVDLLWNFFYERGKDNLEDNIRHILDFFPQHQNLRADQQAVLKAILIMQAIDQRLAGAIDLFKATDQNLSYVFEGITALEGPRAGHIARALVEQGVLVTRSLGTNRQPAYEAAIVGRGIDLEKHKEDVRIRSTTAKLATEGGLATALSLNPALRLRFEAETGSGKLLVVTATDFTRTINTLRDKETGWKFQAVLALARDEAEAAGLRQSIKAAVQREEYKNIVFIDALSTPLGSEAFAQYVDYSAHALGYQGNNNQAASDYANKARQVLEQEWKNRVYNGPIIVSTWNNPGGEKVGNAQGVASILQTIVQQRYPLVFDFAKGVTETQLRPTSLNLAAKAGITQKSSGAVVGLEKHVLPTVWNLAEPETDYWTNPSPASAEIAKIKQAMEERIQEAFQKEGYITTSALWDLLQQEYGFAPCNLSAFLAGFLLKEYSREPYRFSDAAGAQEPMSPGKLSEMLGNYMNGKEKRATMLVKMTPEEMAFYELTEKAWDIPPQSCTSAEQAGRAISGKMQEWGLPPWCLEEVDQAGCFGVVKQFVELVQSEGQAAHTKAVHLGRIAQSKPGLANDLRALLNKEQCQNGMWAFLKRFEDGRILQLAQEIGAERSVIADIRELFSVKHASLWDRETGENEIRKLVTDYGFAKATGKILNTVAQSRPAAAKAWQERLGLFRISCEALKLKRPDLAGILDELLKIDRGKELLPEQWANLQTELVDKGETLKMLLDNERELFATIYAPYLEGLGDEDQEEIRSKLPLGMFALSATECNGRVKTQAEAFKKSQLKAQLFHLWQEKTGTKTPQDWSKLHRTPILCCVPDEEYEQAQNAFAILNRNLGAEYEVQAGLEYLQRTALFDLIGDETKRDAAFRESIVGRFAALLTNLNEVRDRLERLPVDVYAWADNPQVRKRVEELAQAEYQAGGSDKVLTKIESMDDARLKRYLKELVAGNMRVGLEILEDQEHDHA